MTALSERVPSLTKVSMAQRPVVGNQPDRLLRLPRPTSRPRACRRVRRILSWFSRG
jgi:hypothetical protein